MAKKGMKSFRKVQKYHEPIKIFSWADEKSLKMSQISAK